MLFSKQIYSNSYPNLLDKEISLRVENAPLKNAIDQIEKEHQVPFSYSNYPNLSQTVTCNFSSVPLKNVLSHLFKDSDLKFKEISNQITIFKGTFKPIEFTLSGKIYDAKTNEALVGVAVYDEIEKKGAVSDETGSYNLSLSEGAHKLTFSYVGYTSEIRNIELTKNTTLDILLNSESKNLKGVTIEGQAPDRNVTSTEVGVEKMTIEQIEVIPVIMGETDIFKTIQLLRGFLPFQKGKVAL